MLDTSSAIDQATHWRVSQFLARETSLLDHRQFNAWLELLSDDFTYKMPVPVTPDNPARSTWAQDAYVVHETRESLTNLWAKRYDPRLVEYAWGENPPQRTRRLVSNVLVSNDAALPDAYRVESNVLLTFARQSDPIVLVPAGRYDIVRLEGDELKLAERVVHLDATIVTTTHLRMIF